MDPSSILGVSSVLCGFAGVALKIKQARNHNPRLPELHVLINSFLAAALIPSGIFMLLCAFRPDFIGYLDAATVRMVSSVAAISILYVDRGRNKSRRRGRRKLSSSIGVLSGIAASLAALWLDETSLGEEVLLARREPKRLTATDIPQFQVASDGAVGVAALEGTHRPPPVGALDLFCGFARVKSSGGSPLLARSSGSGPRDNQLLRPLSVSAANPEPEFRVFSFLVVHGGLFLNSLGVLPFAMYAVLKRACSGSSPRSITTPHANTAPVRY